MNEILQIIFLLFIIAIFAILILLQVYLSQQKNKFLGLLLPGMYFLFAAFSSFALAAYSGDIIPNIVPFIMFLIPAAFNLLIYYVCRGKLREKNQKEIEKMNIHDLD